MRNTELNIMVLISSLNTGGSERVVTSYCNWLVENTNSKVCLVVLNDTKTLYEINKKVILKKVIVNKKNRIKNIISRNKEIKKVVNEFKPNIIFTVFAKNGFQALFSKSKDMVLIGSERAHLNYRDCFVRLICKYVSLKSDGYIFQTKRAMDVYPSKVKKKSIVIENAVSGIIHEEVKQRDFVITAMGRLTSQKGFDILIEAFNIFSSQYPNYILKIFGEGEDREKLENLIKELNLEKKVFLVGNKKDAINEIAKSKMFVLSSRMEGMPNALMEAMATKTPCIATDCEYGPRELINDYENGILVPVDDIKLLSEKMIELASNQELSDKIALNAGKIIETNSKDNIYRSYYEYMKKIYLKNKKINSKTFFERVFSYLSRNKYLDFLPDKMYLKLLYRVKMHERLNLKNPKNFNEKLQWLKLFDRKDVYTKMVDKAEVKEYAANIIGNKYIIPTIGVFDKFEDIDFFKLPDKFVIKTTHDSGGIVICRDKKYFDTEKSKKKINDSLKVNYFYGGREWPYKNVKPRIIIEEYMEEENSTELKDYKFFCFNGKVKFTLVCSERFTSDNMAKTFFDKNWKVIPVSENKHPIDDSIKKPKNYEKMVELAEILAKNIPFVRIDFYSIKDNIYFGEITFYPSSGLEKFEPTKYNLEFGSWIDLRGNHEK